MTIDNSTVRHYGAPFEDANSVLIHHHIPKTGGSTFNRMIKASFPTHSAKNVLAWPDIIERVNATSKNVAIFHHNSWGIFEYLAQNKNVYMVTWLRHPLTLSSSYLTFMSKRSGIPLSKVKSPHALLLERLGGDIDEARFRLENFFYLFGIMERYEESLALFKSCIPDLDLSAYAHVNKLARKDKYRNNDREFIDQHAESIELYDWACALFEKRLSADRTYQGAIKPKKLEYMVQPTQPKDLSEEQMAEKLESGQLLSVERKRIIAALGDIYLGRRENALFEEAFSHSMWQHYRSMSAMKLLNKHDIPVKGLAVCREFFDILGPYRTTVQRSMVNTLLDIATQFQTKLEAKLAPALAVAPSLSLEGLDWLKTDELVLFALLSSGQDPDGRFSPGRMRSLLDGCLENMLPAHGNSGMTAFCDKALERTRSPEENETMEKIRAFRDACLSASADHSANQPPRDITERHA